MGIAIVSSAVVLGACSSSSSSKSPETTAAKVESEHAAARAEALDRIDKSAELVTELSGRVPDSVARGSQCVIAIPSMLKGGVVIGGQSGKGYAVCQTASGWSAPAPVSIAGGTFGAQLGVQSTDLLALVTNEKGMKALASGNFRVGVDASATAGPVGTGRGAGTDVPSSSDVVSYSRSKGLFAGAELNGTAIKIDEDSTKALYGSSVDMKSILGGRVAPPSGAGVQNFLSAVRTGFGTGRTGATS